MYYAATRCHHSSTSCAIYLLYMYFNHSLYIVLLIANLNICMVKTSKHKFQKYTKHCKDIHKGLDAFISVFFNFFGHLLYSFFWSIILYYVYFSTPLLFILYILLFSLYKLHLDPLSSYPWKKNLIAFCLLIIAFSRKVIFVVFTVK